MLGLTQSFSFRFSRRFSSSVGSATVLQIVPNAAAAYSLRSLAGGNPDVVRVRRSSGGEEDFTAGGVSSGAMLSYVTEARTGWNIQATFNDAPDGTATITSASSTATTSTVSFTGSGTIRVLPKSSYVAAEAGDQVVFNMSVSGLDSAMTFRLRKASSNTSVGSASVNNGNNQDVTLNLTASGGYTGGYPHFTADAGSGAATVTINSVTVNGKSGFVETWYDQSGNGRHSTNTTATQQPIIVDAGVFQDGLKFTHVDTTNGKRLFVPRSAAELGEDFALIWVGKVTESDTSYNNLLGGTRGVQGYAPGTAGISIRSSDGTVAFINEESGTSKIQSDSSTNATLNEDFVAFATYENAEAGPSLDLSVDGNHQNFGPSGYTLSSTKDIGIMNATNSSGGYRIQESPTGVCREVLVYDTNQNANRVALETNINNQYNLF